MNDAISQIKQLIYGVLANAPEQDECTATANEMFVDMQRLRQSIEMFESSGGTIFNTDSPSEEDYARIEMDDLVINASTRFEYDNIESARLRIVEIQAILENDNSDDDEIHDLLVEKEFLEVYLHSQLINNK
jgi:hypothetical protein